jgi:hypothetical protein
MSAPRYDKPERVVEMDGSSGPVAVDIAGFRYWFLVDDKSDCSFSVYEIDPGGAPVILTRGSEQ